MERNQSVWITGASAGIGEALAVKFLKEGFRVALTARGEGMLREFRRTRSGEAQERILLLPCDVTDRDGLAAQYGLLKERWGVPHMIVANAGTHIHMEPKEITFQRCKEILDLNLYGAIGFITLGPPGFPGEEAGRHRGDRLSRRLPRSPYRRGLWREQGRSHQFPGRPATGCGASRDSGGDRQPRVRSNAPHGQEHLQDAFSHQCGTGGELHLRRAPEGKDGDPLSTGILLDPEGPQNSPLSPLPSPDPDAYPERRAGDLTDRKRPKAAVVDA